MTTLTVSISGSTIAGANNTKSYTISDTDLQALLNVIAKVFAVSLPPTPTPAQVELAWLQNVLIQPTISMVQNAQRTVPPPIGLS